MRVLDGAVPPSKDALRAYWTSVWPQALPYLGRRPLTLVRHVSGVTFFHKEKLPPIPEAVHQLRITKRGGEPGVRVWVDDLAGLLGLVDMDVIEVHPWGATIDDIEHADFAVFDLDPGEGIEWPFVVETALALRDFLKAKGHTPWVKTSGGKGFHLMCPLDGRCAWPEVRKWTKDLAAEFATRDRRYTTSATVDRTGRVFVDYLRNGRGNTAVGAFSPRARPGFPVSYPVSWSDVERGIHADAWTMDRLIEKTPVRRVAKRNDAPAVRGKRAAPAASPRVEMPAFVEPLLATLVDKPPEGAEWLHEMKYDGYRGQIAVANAKARFYTRRANDWTAEFPGLLAAAGRLSCRSALIDGEATVLDERGIPDFNKMQRGGDVTYFAFDLLEIDGRDLKRVPLLERKSLLKVLIERSAAAAPFIRYSDHIAGGGAAFFKVACEHGLEGIVSKRADSLYRSGRREEWLKIKCVKRQEFVVGGWLMRQGDPTDLGALLLGFYDGETFTYAGKVGTGKGFDAKTRKRILGELRPMEAKRQAFQEVPEYDAKFVHWTRPEMVVEVEFTDFTADGVIRHPSLIGLRRDKNPREVVLEVPRPTPAPGVIAKSKPRWRRRAK